MRRLELFGLLICAVIGTMILLHDQEEKKAAKGRICRFVATDDFPSWVTSGAWLDKSLLVADVTRRRLVSVSNDGEASPFAREIGDERSGPIRIKAATSSPGFVVELSDGRLISADRSFRGKSGSPLAVATLESGGRHIAALLDWVPAGEDIVGYADIRGSAGLMTDWKNGFVRFSLTKPSAFTVVHERPFPDEARVSMTLTYPLMASIGSTGYVALVEGQMSLWRLGPRDLQLQPMRALPAPLKTEPDSKLPTWLRREEYPGVMAAVERSTMPAGLWSWEGALFLLARAFEGGQRRWYLSKIDPVRDEVLWAVPVPSTADHMTVIPGPNAWAFLEKGPVLAWLSQETRSILFVKSSQMRSSHLKALCP